MWLDHSPPGTVCMHKIYCSDLLHPRSSFESTDARYRPPMNSLRLPTTWAIVNGEAQLSHRGHAPIRVRHELHYTPSCTHRGCSACCVLVHAFTRRLDLRPGQASPQESCLRNLAQTIVVYKKAIRWGKRSLAPHYRAP